MPTLNTKPRGLILAGVLLLLAKSRALAAVAAIPTFHSLGLYWSESGGSADTICDVRFRKAGTTEWRTGFPLWFDARSGVGAGTDVERPANEYRGSLVNLEPGAAGGALTPTRECWAGVRSCGA